MDHNEAKTTHATERYLLNEMAPGERDAFEDHFFDCSECAEDVRDGAKMMAAGREVAREGATVHELRPRRNWFPQAAAAAVIAGVSGLVGWFGAVQTVPRAVPIAAERPSIALPEAIDLDMGENRAPGTATRVPAGKPVLLNVMIPPRDDAASYEISVPGADGKIPVSRDRAVEAVPLQLRALPRGSHEVVIEGVRQNGNRFSITRVPFEVVGER